MKILITGAGGFIGKYLANYLGTEHQVVALSRRDLDIVDRPRLEAIVTETRFDAIVNCAAEGRDQTMVEDQYIFKNNIDGFNNLASLADCYGKLINFGTGAEFDLSTNIYMAREEDIFKCEPKQSYGASKNLISRKIYDMPNAYNLRIFGCFDQSENERRPIKMVTARLDAGIPFSVGNDRWFDMMSLSDIARVVEQVLNNNVHDRDLNLVYDKKYKLSDFLKLFCTITGRDPAQIEVGNVSDKNYCGDGSRLKSYGFDLLGFEKSIQLYNNSI